MGLINVLWVNRVKGYGVCFAGRGWRSSGTVTVPPAVSWQAIVKVFCILIVSVCLTCVFEWYHISQWCLQWYLEQVDHMLGTCLKLSDKVACIAGLSAVVIMPMVIMLVLILCIVDDNLAGTSGFLSGLLASVVFVCDSVCGGLCGCWILICFIVVHQQFFVDLAFI